MPISREYDFTPGPETSTLPTVSDPVSSGDTVTLGYLNDKSFWGEPVASYAAMRALTGTERADNQRRVVDATQETWYFDSASTGTDDGSTILEPDDSPVSGRWIVQVAGGGGGGGGASGIETLLQKLENEKYGIVTEDLDNSVGASGLPGEQSRYFNATLLETVSSGVTSLPIVWNAKALNDSDQNYDATTNWTATGSGASLTATTTAGEFKVGTAGLKFDKGASTTEAGIRYDRSAQTLSLNANSRVWVWVKLPSITQLSNVLLRVYADTTSNFQTFTKTTDYAGNSLAIGWNLLFFDISTGGSAGGTGWDITKLSRYCELAVTTSSAGQTYTGIIFDALYFSYFRPQDIGVVANQFTLFNNSVKEDVTFTSGNTLHDGLLTVSSATTNAFDGGLSGTSRGRVQRTTVASVGDAQMQMDNDSSFSGSIVTTQELRMANMLIDSVSGSLNTVVDMIALQAYEVVSVGGSTIDVSDPANTSANLVNTDAIDIFRPVRINGKTKFILRASLSLTASSSHSSGTTTLTLTTTGIQAGDYACKRNVAQVSHSVVSETSQESFTTSSLDTAPNGVQLINDGIPYVNPAFIYAHYALGSFNQADAVRNRAPAGASPSLSVTGTVNTSASFLRGRFSLEGSSVSNYLSIPASVTELDANTSKLQFSMWFYYGGTSGSTRVLFARFVNPTGVYCTVASGSATVQLQINGSANTGLSAVVGWNHLAVVVNDSASNYFYLNGVKSDVLSATPSALSSPLTIMAATGPGTGAVGLYLADFIVWRGGTTITTGQSIAMYNGGNYQPQGAAFRQRYKYVDAGVTGQKLTTRVRVSRTTNAITPTIWKACSIII